MPCKPYMHWLVGHYTCQRVSWQSAYEYSDMLDEVYLPSNSIISSLYQAATVQLVNCDVVITFNNADKVLSMS